MSTISRIFTLSAVFCLFSVSQLSAQSASYEQALVATHQSEWKQANTMIRRATQLDKRNLNAWKMRVWLSARTGQYRDTLRTIEWLSNRLPGESATSKSRQRKGMEIVGLAGEVFGFLTHVNDENSVEVQIAYEDFRGGLTSQQVRLFDRAVENVASRYSRKAATIEQVRQHTQVQESDYRQTRLAKLVIEREEAVEELRTIEERISDDRQRASEERNVQAATRSNENGYSYGNRNQSYFGAAGAARDTIAKGRNRYGQINLQQGGGLALGGTNTGTFVINGVNQSGLRLTAAESIGLGANRERQFGFGTGQASDIQTSGFSSSTGLGDKHYVDANRREAEYTQRLNKQRSNLKRQLGRITREERILMRSPNLGVTPQVASARSHVTSFTTYVSIPVDVNAELTKLNTSDISTRLEATSKFDLEL